MQKIGIIGEYNPFHNGHLYHIATIKDLYPDSIIILVLNGYFLQRGEISLLTKEDKVKIALAHEVDLVVELPFVYGTQSADIFAEASIKILEALKCDAIICGSESNDLVQITKIAKKQLEDKAYNNEVKSYLKEGLNYPTALAKALNLKFNFLPNDLLAISYQKAILKNNFHLKLKTIKRTSDYHDLTSTDAIISASNIRHKWENHEDITNYLPSAVAKKMLTINMDHYFKLLKYALITNPQLNQFVDVDEGLEYRLKKYITATSNLTELIKKVKTKRYTFNKLNRLFIHILVGLTKTDNEKLQLDYLKILGFNAHGKKYLKTIKKDIPIPIVRNTDSALFKYELLASQIYDLINDTKTVEFEIKNKPIIKK